MSLAVSTITDKRRKLEIAAVVITGSGKFVFMDFLQWKLPFILISIFAWTTYVVYRQRKVPGILAYWGFRSDNFGKVVKMILPFGIASLAMFVVIGLFRHTINVTWHVVPILILYPIWGVIQQFLVITLVGGNLMDMREKRISNRVIIFMTAVLFGLLHYPHHWLVLGTFVLALLYGFIYMKSRNIFVMGLFHGWLGGLFFYTVVDRDPFAEVFGPLLY